MKYNKKGMKKAGDEILDILKSNELTIKESLLVLNQLSNSIIEVHKVPEN